MAKEKQFTKTDMERVGVFREMDYITIGDKYKSGGSMEFNQAASKGNQMLPGGSKTRSALQTGYFSDKFNRILEAEAYSDPVKVRRQYRMKETQKNLGKPFLPSSGEKKPSGLGSHYGTLSGPITALSPQGRARKPYQVAGKNFYTNPGKKGTGFGYTSVTIGGYYTHKPDEYDRARHFTKKENEAHQKAMKGSPFKLNMHPNAYFDGNPYRSDKSYPTGRRSAGPKRDVKPFKPSSPGKNPGGMKAGTFDPYPSHPADHYIDKMPRAVNIVNKSGKIFMPSAGPKSAPVNSVVNQNVVKTINSTNYKTLPPVMSY